MWISGPIVQESVGLDASLEVYNASGSEQQVSARAIDNGGDVIEPNGGPTATIAPGDIEGLIFDCGDFGGCVRTYELRTTSDAVVPSLVYTQADINANLEKYDGVVAPGDFFVIGPNGRTTPATVQGIEGRAAALQGDTAQLRQDTKQLKKKLKKVLKAVKKRR